MQLIFDFNNFGEGYNIINNNTKESFINVSYLNGNLIVDKFDGSQITIPLPISSAGGGQVLSTYGYLTLGTLLGDYNVLTISAVDYIYDSVKNQINTESVINLGPGDSSYDRVDAIYIDSSDNTIKKLEGTPSTTPVMPVLSIEKILVGVVYVKRYATDTQKYYSVIYSAFPNQQAQIIVEQGTTIDTLEDLKDVTLNNSTQGQVLTYNESINKWVNTTLNIPNPTDIDYIRVDPTTITLGGYYEGSTPNFTDIREMFDEILYPFVIPEINLISSSLHQSGLTINKTINFNIIPGDGIITSKDIYKSSSSGSVLDYTLTSNSGSYVSNGLYYLDAIPSLYPYFAFDLFVTYSNYSSQSISLLVEFAGLTYYGSISYDDINQTNIKLLPNNLKKISDDINLIFNPILERFVYAYPSSFGNLTKIVDQNGDDVTDSFTLLVMNITLDDATILEYNVYYSNDDTTQTNFKMSFYF